jgi:hypothetical protein
LSDGSPSNEASTGTGPPTGSNEGSINSASGEVVPPLPSQLRTTLEPPGDSPPLPKVHEDLLNDGITDQVSRRSHRRPVVIGALVILIAFTLCLTGIVGTLGYTFAQALRPENVAKFAAVQLHEEINKLSLASTEKTTGPSSSSAAPQKSSKEVKLTDPKSEKDATPVKESGTVRIEAKIYGEVRDSMVPLVALVSILTVAIVVILGTMLRAAFAPHPNNSSDFREKDDVSPVPLLEALKGLVESVKAAWK